MGAPLPVVVSVPHGGIHSPEEASGLCMLDERDFALDGDTWARELYVLRDDVLGYIDTTVPRAIVDMNRSPYARSNPDGIIKTVSLQGKQVWRDPDGPPRSLSYLLVSRYHWEYHKALEELSRTPGPVLGLDCHTMLATGSAIGPDPGRPRPLICIGNGGDGSARPAGEPTTAPAGLVIVLRDALVAEFRHEDVDVDTVAVNDPFKGGYVCRRHGQFGPLPWIQLELSRALYLPADREIGAEPDPEDAKRLSDLRRKILGALRRLFA